MVRKEKIYEYLKKIADTCQNETSIEIGVDSSIIADYIGADRSNVSRDLNQLVREGGILFLDEIHRLPPEGQELLFLLMDKGSYRRLGETEETRKANILIIGATTEDLNASLLQTFLRRMPVTIHLPGLEERYIEERLEMVELFFATEQRNMGVKVSVAREVLLALLLYECKGNIGQLKADVQLVCARGFLDYKANKEE